MRKRKALVWGESHTGYKRRTNEDRFLIRRLEEDRDMLLAVADGMGGEPGGDVAAQIVIETLDQSPISDSATDRDLKRILEQAHEKIRQRGDAETDLATMGTTATAVLIRHKTAYWAHVGDSRLYHFRAGSLEQITNDHKYLQELVDDGTMSQAEADRHPLRNVLDRCVGCDTIRADRGRFEVADGDRLLLCTDGLMEHLSNGRIEAALVGGTAWETVQNLMAQALHDGGRDNITVIIMDVKV